MRWCTVNIKIKHKCGTGFVTGRINIGAEQPTPRANRCALLGAAGLANVVFRRGMSCTLSRFWMGLLLGGRMMVGELVSRAELVGRTKNDRYYDAPEWIVAQADSGTRLDLHRALDPALTRRLRFNSRKSKPKTPFFVSEGKLDGQTTRGIRELTPESARLLDRIITITDCGPLSDVNEADHRRTVGKRGKLRPLRSPSQVI